MELTEFLLARLDEDEQTARHIGGRWRRDGINSVEDEDGRLVVYGDGPAPDGAQAEHIARHHPARVLAQVAAIRAIVDRYQKALKRDRDNEGDLAAAGRTLALHGVMKDLAAIWADHEAYDPAWSSSAAPRPRPPATRS